MDLEFNTESIISLISCLITALGAFLIKALEKKNNSNINDNILEQQLNKIYEPFAKQIEISDNYSMNSDFYKFIEQNLNENFSLYPSKLKEMCIEILDKPYLLCPNNNYIENLEQNILSNYNWIRKKLNYPYDANKIQTSCVEIGNTENKRKNTIKFGIALNNFFLFCFPILIVIVIKLSLQKSLLNIIFIIISSLFSLYLVSTIYCSIRYTLKDKLEN